MTGFATKPSLTKIKKLFPIVVEVPKGFKTHTQKICFKYLGPSYYSYSLYSRKQLYQEDAVWQYLDGKIFFKEEHNASLISLALLTKRRRNENKV